MDHAPPVARLALAFSVGAAWELVGAPWQLAPLAALVLLAWPTGASLRLRARVPWVAVALAGIAAARSDAPERGCLSEHGAEVERVGRFVGAPSGGSGVFRVEGCPDFTAVVADSTLPAGRAVRLVGSWREGRSRPWFSAAEATLLLEHPGDQAWSWKVVRWRERLLRRLRALYGEQASLVAALTLARAEGMDPELRESFSRVGIAHLLAISGFHVGVVAGSVLTFLRVAGIGPRPSELTAVGASWAYVVLIGLPDPAVRAAIMLSLVALARARGRPVARWGPFAAAWLLLVAAGPTKMASIGFQLSFAGVAGLLAWAGPLASRMRRLGPVRVNHALATGLAAGVAATLATVPVVAWHFERVSLVGIPMTLLATPLVSLALVGALASLAADFLSRDAAAFLAGGVALLLGGLERLTGLVAAWPWASAWTTRTSVVAGCAGLAIAVRAARRPRIGARARRLLVAVYVAAAILAWPLVLTWQGRGTAELVAIDVGQGDAIAVRSPRGRWLLVDAGPPPRGPDPLAHPVVRALRARGVRRLEALVLTHAHLDHIGGAAAVLEAFDVATVYDPAYPAASRDYLEVLSVAARRSISWRAARAGARIELDGIVVEFLHPERAMEPVSDLNESSVVLRVSYGAWDALLTGDQYRATERRLAERLGDIEVLKVGHHGSDTSTDSLLLERVRPELALISVGRSNRYGHPDADVLARLARAGVRVLRTDRDGTLSVLARPDGSQTAGATRLGLGRGRRRRPAPSGAGARRPAVDALHERVRCLGPCSRATSSRSPASSWTSSASIRRRRAPSPTCCTTSRSRPSSSVAR